MEAMKQGNILVEQKFSDLVNQTRSNTTEFISAGAMANTGSSADELSAGDVISALVLNEADKVQPGDLITAEWMNKLLHRLAVLEAVVGLSQSPDKGTFAMPNLFGVALREGIAILKRDKLHLNKVLNTFGQRTSQQLTKAELEKTLEGLIHMSGRMVAKQELDLLVKNANLPSVSPIILAQFPVPNERVKPNASVNLLVTTNPGIHLALFSTIFRVRNFTMKDQAMTDIKLTKQRVASASDEKPSAEASDSATTPDTTSDSAAPTKGTSDKPKK